MTGQPRATLSAGQFLVDGEPRLLRGGELHNSASSTARYAQPLWARARELGVNTVLASVSWAQWEPEEGIFQHQVVDHLIRGARDEGLHLILLWFGSWKNGVSSYAPPWVKSDQLRFPFAQDADSATLPALSVFSDDAAAADARSFAALMSRVRETDREAGTVVMVQVENEVGLLRSSRDHSPLARRAWKAQPPEVVRAHFAAPDARSWDEIHADNDLVDEAFMSWHYAHYLEGVAAAGKREWPLPMYTNAWLNAILDEEATTMSGGRRPGEYPSGGPVPRVLPLWVAAAPHLDFYAPDLYQGGIEEWCQAYREATGVTFIPELRRDTQGIGEMYRAVGSCGALGVSPFGIDTIERDEARALSRVYRHFRVLETEILAAQRSGTIRGFAVTENAPEVSFTLGDVRFEIERDFDPRGEGNCPDGYGLLLLDAHGSYFLAGTGIVVRARMSRSGRSAWVLSCDEVDEEDGELVVVRVLNGDETGGGEIVRITRDDPPGFGPIPIAPALTGMLRFTFYER